VQGALGRMAYDREKWQRGRELQEESLRHFREAGDAWGIAWCLGLVVREVLLKQDYNQATRLLQESLRLRRTLGDDRGIAWALHQLGLVARASGKSKRAKAHMIKALSLRARLGDKRGIASSLHDLGNIALDEGDPARATQLFAAAESLRDAIGAHLPPQERIACERDVSRVRDLLEDMKFRQMWAQGREMALGTWVQDYRPPDAPRPWSRRRPLGPSHAGPECFHEVRETSAE
jgi:tetratricopeptide (TPR) repeat protein